MDSARSVNSGAGSDGSRPKRVLVIRIGRLGDTILATPIIEVLHNALGQNVLIDFAAGPGASTTILQMDRRINHVFSIDRRRLHWRFHPVKRKLREHSRSFPYDLVVNLECGTECDDFFRFVEARHFCGRPLAEPQHMPGRHCVDTEKSIYAAHLGMEVTASADPSMEIQFDPDFSQNRENAHDVVLNPGFSGLMKNDYRAHRGWPLASWAHLIGLLSERGGLSVAINGALDERGYFDSLLAIPGVHSLFGATLQTLANSLLQARCLVSVDTGTMHLSAALGTPVVALFGPTNPELTGPYSKKVDCTVVRSGVDCQPCVRSAQQKRCTFNRCMQALTPETVFASVKQLIAHP